MAYRLTLTPGDLVAHVEWDGTTHHRADQLMVTSEQSDDRRVLDGVVAQLIDGALNIRADDVAKVARATGIATRTITARLRKVG